MAKRQVVSKKIKDTVISLPISFMCELPNYRKIKSTWNTKNPQLFNDNSERLLCEEWSGEEGFVYYYFWLMKNNYVPGKSILRRIDKNKGFSPDNCIIESKRTDKGMKKLEEFATLR